MNLIYQRKIQQLYHVMNEISKEYAKTPHEIFEDVFAYHTAIRLGLVKNTQTRIDFFTSLSERALEFSQKEVKR
jgi:hypothetical protein